MRTFTSTSASTSVSTLTYLLCYFPSPSHHGPIPIPDDAIVVRTAAGDNGAPKVTLRRAPGRGRNFHGARRPSGISLSNPVCVKVVCALPFVYGCGGAGVQGWGFMGSRRTGHPHGDDRRRSGCLHQNTAAANAGTRGLIEVDMENGHVSNRRPSIV
jgi:hypothetical protein